MTDQNNWVETHIAPIPDSFKLKYKYDWPRMARIAFPIDRWEWMPDDANKLYWVERRDGRYYVGGSTVEERDAGKDMGDYFSLERAKSMATRLHAEGANNA